MVYVFGVLYLNAGKCAVGRLCTRPSLATLKLQLPSRNRSHHYYISASHAKVLYPTAGNPARWGISHGDSVEQDGAVSCRILPGSASASPWRLLRIDDFILLISDAEIRGYSTGDLITIIESNKFFCSALKMASPPRENLLN